MSLSNELGRFASHLEEPRKYKDERQRAIMIGDEAFQERYRGNQINGVLDVDQA